MSIKFSQDYEYSSVLIDLPRELADRVRKIGESVRAGDLVSMETRPHVTLMFGLHTEDSKQVESVLASEGPISVRLGKTDFFPPDDQHNDDVVHVRVFSPDLHRLHAKIRRTLPHTANYPKYRPHVSVARVKAGSGVRYVGRSDLDLESFDSDEVWFSNKSGRRSRITVKSAQDLGSVPLWLLAGGGAGLLTGRYFLPSLLSRFGFDPDRARLVGTLGGVAAGLLPGLALGLSRQKLTGNFFGRVGEPITAADKLRYSRYALGKPQTTLPVKRGSVNPHTYDPALWRPSFGVAQAMDDVATNPMIPLSQRVRMRQLIAESGRSQGVGMTGMASPGALMDALPRVVSNAVPTVGGAWAVSELLGAPNTLKNTAVGLSLVYSALKGFMES